MILSAYAFMLDIERQNGIHMHGLRSINSACSKQNKRAVRTKAFTKRDYLRQFVELLADRRELPTSSEQNKFKRLNEVEGMFLDQMHKHFPPFLNVSYTDFVLVVHWSYTD